MGDQKFISLSSEGFALKTCFEALLLNFRLSIDASEAAECSSSFGSSAIIPTDWEMARFASKLDNIQLPWYFSGSPKAFVKYLFWSRRLLLGDVLGEDNGEAGRDLLPRRKEDRTLVDIHRIARLR